MKLTQTHLRDVVIIQPTVYEDERGWFMESFNEVRFHEGLEKLGLAIPRAFVQDNHSYSHKGVVRGLHFQTAPHEQGKLVRVIQGAVFDVAVDIRRESSSYGQWVGVTLSAENRNMLWIPEGFAHGFMALENDTQFTYKTTSYYSRDCERSILWNDTALSIDWPLVEAQRIISEKDATALPWSREPQ